MTVEQVVDAMAAMPAGEVVTVPEMIGNLWKTFGSKSERGMFGKEIRKLVDSGYKSNVTYAGLTKGRFGKVACYRVS